MARLADIQAARLAGALLTGDAVNGDAVKRDAPFTLISRRKVRFWIGASATLAAIILISWKVESHDPQSSGLSLGEQSSIQEKDMKFTQAMSVAVAASSICSGVTAQSTAVQWTVASGGNGHWYERVNLPSEITWTSSNAAANALNGHLVTLTSAAEQSWVYQTLVVGQSGCFTASWAIERAAWIGLFQDTTDPAYSEPNGGWKWVTNEPLSYNNWHPGEPNNGSLENVAGMFVLYQGQWNDEPNDAGIYCYSAYIIEWSADCNSDGIVDYGQILSGQLIDANSNGIPDCCESGTACEVNLIQNGGFEFGPVQPDCSWVIHSLGSPFVSGWSVVTASVDRERLSLMCPPTLESWMSYEGEYTVDLDGDAAGGAIAQTVQTIPGVPYRLSFELTGNCTPGTKRMSVEIGQVSAQFEHVCTASNPQTWSKKTIDFTAIDLQTTIVMRSLMKDGRNGPVIDDVRLVVHPSDPCLGDINLNSIVDAVDLAMVLTSWGTSGSEYPRADVNHDGVVNGPDLGALLGGWGLCP